MGGAQRVDGWGEVSGFQSPSHVVGAGGWGGSRRGAGLMALSESVSIE